MSIQRKSLRKHQSSLGKSPYQQFLGNTDGLKSSTPNVQVHKDLSSSNREYGEALDTARSFGDDIRSLRKGIKERIEEVLTSRTNEESNFDSISRHSIPLKTSFDPQKDEEFGKLTKFTYPIYFNRESESFREDFSERERKIGGLEESLARELKECDFLVEEVEESMERGPTETLYYSLINSTDLQLTKEYTNCLLDINSIKTKLKDHSVLTTKKFQKEQNLLFESLKRRDQEMYDLLQSIKMQSNTKKFPNSKRNQLKTNQTDGLSIKQYFQTQYLKIKNNSEGKLRAIKSSLVKFKEKTEKIRQNFLRDIEILERVVLEEKLEYEKIISGMSKEEKEIRKLRYQTVADLKYFGLSLRGRIEELEMVIEGIRVEIGTVRESKIELLEAWNADKRSTMETKEKLREIFDKVYENLEYAENLAEKYEMFCKGRKTVAEKEIEELNSNYEALIRKLEDRLVKFQRNCEQNYRDKIRNVKEFYDSKLKEFGKYR